MSQDHDRFGSRKKHGKGEEGFMYSREVEKASNIVAISLSEFHCVFWDYNFPAA